VHDKVVSICPRDGTVTMKLTLGYTFGKPIFYLSTESNHPLIATLEGAIHAPATDDLPFALEDAAPGESAERIYAIANGPTGLDHPFRQGVNSALSDGRGPLNILGGIPTINWTTAQCGGCSGEMDGRGDREGLPDAHDGCDPYRGYRR
jgi:hypothetical protein